MLFLLIFYLWIIFSGPPIHGIRHFCLCRLIITTNSRIIIRMIYFFQSKWLNSQSRKIIYYVTFICQSVLDQFVKNSSFTFFLKVFWLRFSQSMSFLFTKPKHRFHVAVLISLLLYSMIDLLKE